LKDEQQADAAERIYADLRAAGIDVLFDDRAERAGVKFKDADLIGIPFRVVVGKGIVDGNVEFVDRASGQASDARLGDIVGLLADQLAPARRPENRPA
jgi:prolyl-tRNA synthetase